MERKIIIIPDAGRGLGAYIAKAALQTGHVGETLDCSREMEFYEVPTN